MESYGDSVFITKQRQILAEVVVEKLKRSWMNALNWHINNFLHKNLNIEDLAHKYQKYGYTIGSEYIEDVYSGERGIKLVLEQEQDRAKDFLKVKRVICWGDLVLKSAASKIKYIDLEFEMGIYKSSSGDFRRGVEKIFIESLKEEGFEDVGCGYVGEIDNKRCGVVVDSFFENNRITILITSTHKIRGVYEAEEVLNRSRSRFKA